ncbi:MAG TPA: hypothetical protein VL096_11485, partial [Pirellulaceae bacterium]|nr:hypothetical protein [Pirellulaceae bacterium]
MDGLTVNLRLRTTAIALAWLATGCLSTSLRAAEIELKAHCQPAGAMVLLGDVAHVHGAPATETKSLTQLELVPAPSTGRQRSLRLREVQDLLALQGVKL